MNISLKHSWLIFLVISIVLLGVPRFDRLGMLGIDQYTSGGKAATVVRADAKHYINHVLYFRGEVGTEKLKKP